MPRTFVRVHVIVATDEDSVEATSSVRWELEQPDVDSIRLATLLRDDVQHHIGPAIRLVGKAKPPILTDRSFLEGAVRKEEPNGTNGTHGAENGAKSTSD